MGRFVINLPDVGEGIAEAELTEWEVAVGDVVEEDDVLGSVMTDKAAVEVPSAVSGKVVWLCGEPGDMIAIGSKFVEIEVSSESTQGGPTRDALYETETEVGTSGTTDPEADAHIETPDVSPKTPRPQPATLPNQTGTDQAPATKPLASPSVRQAARDQGISLFDVTGTGPGGRIEHKDLSNHISGLGNAKPSTSRDVQTKQMKIVGMRRQIAQKMVLSKTRIPHITIVEEVDVTELESLRKKLNQSYAEERGKLTLLPFIASAISIGSRDHPEMNATYDEEKGIVTQHAAVHIGMAAQTPAGLTVPVIKHADSNSLWETAAEISRLSQAARSGKASVSDLTGATITISSLGALGALATTPIINHPEVAIIGVNKVAIRPMWNGQSFEPRQMMNLSSSFDHRVIDGWDAALFVKKLKDLLETPALLFVEA